MLGYHPCNTKTNNKQLLSTTNLLLLDISWSISTMSNSENERIWEKFYEEAKAKGMRHQQAMIYANEQFDKLKEA
mgnify:FL=1